MDKRYEVLSRQADFERLRAEHPSIEYLGYGIEKRDDYHFRLEYRYLLAPDLHFIHYLDINSELALNLNETFVYYLGFLELISYYKLACPAQIILPYRLDNEDWWEKLYLNGLGEFFYRNGISFTETPFKFIPRTSASFNPPKSSSAPSYPNLLLVSGGKDTCVSLEKLAAEEFAVLMVNPRGPEFKILDIFASKYYAPKRILVKRTIDPHLLELNNRGYLNGHTPFSAMLAFLSTALGSFEKIIVSNEASASEAALMHNGIAVNHQYSKSEHFEKDFQEFSKQYSSSYYYSILRPFNELQICASLSKLPEYWQVFISCNINSTSWCEACPKCVFVYLMMQVYLSPEEMGKIFTRDLVLAYPEIVKDLIGEGTKPMECIGTFAECREAYDKWRENLRAI